MSEQKGTQRAEDLSAGNLPPLSCRGVRVENRGSTNTITKFWRSWVVSYPVPSSAACQPQQGEQLCGEWLSHGAWSSEHRHSSSPCQLASHCSASWAQLTSVPHQMCSSPCPFAAPQRYLKSFVSWFICTIHFLSASNTLKRVLCIAFTLQTHCMLVGATAADTTCDTTARTQDSFLSAWQCHQQLLESCKERGHCGVQYVSIGQG